MSPTRARPPRRYLRHLLLDGSEWIEARMVQAAEREGFGFVTPAMNRLFAHMGHGPIGVSELARRLSITRQSVYQTALEAQRHGVIDIEPNPGDGRVKMLRFNARGRRMSQSAARSLDEIEAEIAERIGREDLETLRRILDKAWPAEQDPKPAQD